MRIVVGLAGHSGSGKSTTARRLAEQYGFALTSFGDIVRTEAKVRGLGEDISTLQELGQSLIHEWGWERFCETVLSGKSSTQKLIVDGIRHSAAANTLRQLVAPGKFILIFINSDEHVRRQRLALRSNMQDHKSASDDHPVKHGIDELRGQAEIVVDGANDSPAELIARALIERNWL